MNLRETYPTRRPPYIRRPKQTEAIMVASGTETPGDAQKAITQFTKQIQLINDGGTWFVDENNGVGRASITGAYWDPDFRVKGFKLFLNADTNYAQWVYDTPFSQKIVDNWSCGIVHPGHITRVWTGDPSMTATNISIFG